MRANYFGALKTITKLQGCSAHCLQYIYLAIYILLYSIVSVAC